MWAYNRPASFQSLNTSYLGEYAWCDVVKEGYPHQYNFIRIMLKVFIHIHNVTLLFNLPSVNYLNLVNFIVTHKENHHTLSLAAYAQPYPRQFLL